MLDAPSAVPINDEVHPMSAADVPPTETHSNTDTPLSWGKTLEQWMEEKQLRNRDLVQLTGYSSGQITGWLQDRNGVSPEAALKIAKALGVIPSRALRAAGYLELAQVIEDVAAGRRATHPNDDPTTVRAREYTHDLPRATADEITRDLIEQVGRAYEYARLRAAERRRELGLDDKGQGA